MNLEVYERKQWLPNLSYYSGICIDGQRKNIINSVHGIWYPNPYLTRQGVT